MLNLFKEIIRFLTGKLKLSEATLGRIALPALIFLLAGFLLGKVAVADSSTIPGSESDPLVTASWVEAKLSAFSQALKEERDERQSLEDRMRQLEGGSVELPSPQEPVIIQPTPPPTFEVVAVAAGQKLLSGSGTEFILRSGRVRAIEGAGGGLSDLTSGSNLASGKAIERDHLILSPREDGRGATAETAAIFLIRGIYIIE